MTNCLSHVRLPFHSCMHLNFTRRPHRHVDGSSVLFDVVTDDHHMMVELACGAALAAAYGDKLEQLQRDGQLSWTSGHLVVVVCGGGGVNVDMLLQWKNNFL